MCMRLLEKEKGKEQVETSEKAAFRVCAHAGSHRAGLCNWAEEAGRLGKGHHHGKGGPAGSAQGTKSFSSQVNNVMWAHPCESAVPWGLRMRSILVGITVFSAPG